MLTILDRGPGRVLGFRLKGKLTEEALERATALMEARIEEHGKIRVLFHLVDMGGIEPGALVEDLKFGIKHLRDFERYAAVGDQSWLGPWMKGVGFLVPGEGRVYRSDDLEEAWGWLEEEP